MCVVTIKPSKRVLSWKDGFDKSKPFKPAVVDDEATVFRGSTPYMYVITPKVSKMIKVS